MKATPRHIPGSGKHVDRLTIGTQSYSERRQSCSIPAQTIIVT
ncbi:MAG: hypothetical protein SOH81_09015 [Acetobacter sp.]